MKKKKINRKPVFDLVAKTHVSHVEDHEFEIQMKIIIYCNNLSLSKILGGLTSNSLNQKKKIVTKASLLRHCVDLVIILKNS